MELRVDTSRRKTTSVEIDSHCRKDDHSHCFSVNCRCKCHEFPEVQEEA